MQPLLPAPKGGEALAARIAQREKHHTGCLQLTIERSQDEVLRAVSLLRRWMVNRTIIRVLGAGRARLAGAIPANRLAHGGARLFIVDDIIPMPHTYRAGGIIAVSASGKTPTVLEALAKARAQTSGITILGIASHEAQQFAGLCDVFIGIQKADTDNPLQALADTGEYVISRLLDALVVEAGRAAGYDDTTWRLGHENLGPTGPYDSVKGQLKRHPLWYHEGDSFIGRRSELEEIAGFLDAAKPGPGRKILCIHGELGVGKRALVERACALYEARRGRPGRPRLVAVSGYWRSWPTILSQLVADLQNGGASRYGAAHDILLGDNNGEVRTLVVTNLDPGILRDQAFLEFAERVDATEGAKLLVTCQTNKLPASCSPLVRGRPLARMDGHINDLLGETTVDQMTPQEHRRTKMLGGNPQKLIYLRFRMAHGQDDLSQCLEDLADDEKVRCGLGTLSPASAQRAPLSSAPADLSLFAPLLALGGLRACRIPEALLRYLWDGMDRGGAGLYDQFLGQLLALGFLQRNQDGSGDLHLHAAVHAELRKAQLEELLPIRANEGGHFVGQYHRARMALHYDRFRADESHRNHQTIDALLEDLERYTYHSVKYGKHGEVHEHLFASDYLRVAFRFGLADKLRAPLVHLHTGLHLAIKAAADMRAALAKDGKAPTCKQLLAWADQERRLAQVEAELARVAKDSGRYGDVKPHLDEAKERVAAARNLGCEMAELDGADKLPSRVQTALDELESVIFHYRGIACSQMGLTDDCIEAYRSGFEHAVESGTVRLRDVLSLGYLAYEMKFHDMPLAEALGDLSVHYADLLVKRIDDKSVLVKNLCNLAQIHSLGLNSKGSEAALGRAFDIHDQFGVGTRELNRMRVNGSVTAILAGNWALAREYLDHAEVSLLEYEYDRRRYMAKAYRGILLYREAQAHGHEQIPGEAIISLRTALTKHLEHRSWREVIYESLTLAWLTSPDGGDPTLAAIATDGTDKLLQEAAMQVGAQDKSSLFERFWRDHYKPALLVPQSPTP